jgi:hypothetical protein
MAFTKITAAGINTTGNFTFGDITVTSIQTSDGSPIGGAGLGTAIDGNDKIYYTDTVLSIGSTTTINPPDSSNVAYTQYAEIAVEEGFDLIVEDGDDLVPDILGLSTGTAAPLAGAGGRVRADNFTNKAGTGAPTFPNGVNVTGNVAATSATFSGTEAITLPRGTTAERPGSPVNGMIRYNTTVGALEQYNISGWVAISIPPVISSVSPQLELATDDPQSIVITGSNFDTLSTADVIGNNGTVYTPTTSTRNSTSQITITFAGGDVLSGTNEPYDVRVTSGTGLNATLARAFNINDVPTFTTTSGSIATVYEDTAVSGVAVTATDPEGLGVTYSITSGALPTGLSLNTNTGAITGTPNVNDTYNASGVAHNFTVSASDGANTAATRSFSVLRKWLDGTSESLAASSAKALYDLGITGDGVRYINFGGTVKQVYCDLTNGGWMMFARFKDPNSGWSASSSAAGASNNYAAYTNWGYDSNWWTTSTGESDLTPSDYNDDNIDYKSWMFGNATIDSNGTNTIRMSNSRDGLGNANSYYTWNWTFNSTLQYLFTNATETTSGTRPANEGSYFNFNSNNGIGYKNSPNSAFGNWTNGYARIPYIHVGDQARYATYTFSGAVGIKWISFVNSDTYGGAPTSSYSLDSNYEQGKSLWMWVQ